MSHRLFIAIRPASAIRDALIDLMDGVENARWQDDDQLHLTLRYIGETDPHQADDLAEALGRLSVGAFELAVSGVGSFARKGVPHTLWAGIAASEPLLHLQRKVERVCVSVGIAPESRKFAPHITLARLNQSCGPLAPFLARHAGLALGPWQVDTYALYESHLRPQGSLYEPVVTFRCEE
ncbi:RNA 2',3'-cyclic phosphodiesterase [Qipengyuania aquimaris]|uniref:RNA 2',3'-cyclic phosphodiesterase n=1 Tax=Qipengyuania aquimaris TaxID=255984 RepID=UPI001FD52F94|nr:RNA 2',3'-cyclic phosphodiesterase [Qipengyuania aquimaris]UOR15029.1 RNA 2',3'-cyclic phosphodiesterase [Qipengyuania aquimaris]